MSVLHRCIHYSASIQFCWGITPMGMSLCISRTYILNNLFFFNICHLTVSFHILFCKRLFTYSFYIHTTLRVQNLSHQTPKQKTQHWKHSLMAQLHLDTSCMIYWKLSWLFLFLAHLLYIFLLFILLLFLPLLFLQHGLMSQEIEDLIELGCAQLQVFLAKQLKHLPWQ